MVLNICGVCREERNDLISLKFIDEAGPILRKLKRFIDRSVSKFYNRNFQICVVLSNEVCVFIGEITNNFRVFRLAGVSVLFCIVRSTHSD